MSHNEKNVPSEPKETGTLPRVRSTSECSYTSDDGATGFTEKRQRTTSQQFMVTSGLTAASPPKFVSLEEIMQAANGMRDMALVHQIVVDEDFKLKRAEHEPNSIQRIIKDTMHKAFWDVLREQIAEEPPNYTQALNLLEEIKQGLFALLLPQHTRIKQQISEILDSELIKQQAEKGILDFNHYAQYVISVMSKLCAPVRDDKIRELTETSDVIDTFKGILETLDLMQLDMANFTLQMARPDIIACSVDLERKKFADFLAVQNDGLEHTRKWLLKHVNTTQTVPSDIEYEKFIKNILKRAFVESCADLLDWEANTPYPETFMLDEDRLHDLQSKTCRLISIATILLVTISNAGPDLQSIAQFKQSIKEHIFILLQSVKTEKRFTLTRVLRRLALLLVLLPTLIIVTFTYLIIPVLEYCGDDLSAQDKGLTAIAAQDLKEVLPNVAEQVVNDLKEAQKKYELSEMFQAHEANLKQQIVDVGQPDHKVKGIVKQRVKDFFLDIIESSTAAPQKVPSGLTALQQELTEIAGQFLRVVSHNSTVFCIYYYDIMAAALPKPA